MYVFCTPLIILFTAKIRKLSDSTDYFFIHTFKDQKVIALKMREEQFMNAALAEAVKAYDKQEVPVGAVVVYNDMIIARAHNLTETLKDPTAHAEMQAITAASNFLGGKYLKDCTIYVTLEPCAMCAGAIGWSQASSLVYGANDESKGFTNVTTPLLHPKTTVRKGLLEDECRELLLKFFKKHR
jgi:tRNA(adenine34) deaminase